ncbi:MAG: c-type cytochrome [Chitinophagaceae bacterium]|nr:c-type cytochrome [Chitinophagaceae bacterium]
MPNERNCTTLFFATFFLGFSVFFCSCNNKPATADKAGTPDTLTEAQKHMAQNGLLGLQVAEGLEVTVMATEPMLKNPTNMDVDERGRVWITEAYNYRPSINGNPINAEGDRIIILEDTNGDGRFDTSKVFYQGPEINAPLGVCVLGKQVLVSQSPYLWSFYDDNGDDKADRKEIVFQGIGGEQHDHGMHSVTFAVDGKLYFNFGNEGKTLKDKNNRVVRDQDGDEIGPAKYKQGMVFRCNPDGTKVECLGHNFRNNYEVAVDSYGAMWQSDNDDDGNRGVRINYVMDYGNYGYKDEMTNAAWAADRTNIEDSIPLRHWHLNDPGVVPNLLQTGSGSPTGMVIYEGSLLPDRFQNQMIHADPGPNVVRSYALQKDKAGYKANILNILKGENDQWFRPADICVAPDGSLLVADWYDPGVGGHQAGDQQKGRIYRVAPKGSLYKVPQQDYSTASGAITALQNPNLAVRHHAWLVLQNMGASAVPELEKVWHSKLHDRVRARAFWALVKLPGGDKYIREAAGDSNPDVRMAALRAARELKINAIDIVSLLVADKEPQVRRECALALRHLRDARAASLWAQLANQHDGTDRWYLEALGIGADGQWDAFFTAYLALNPSPLKTDAGRDIVWRARTDKAVPLLATLAADESAELKARLRYFRAFDFNKGPLKSSYLLHMIQGSTSNNLSVNKLVLHHLDAATVKKSAVAMKAMTEVLDDIKGSSEYLDLVSQYNLKSEKNNLLQMVLEKPDSAIGRNAASILLKLDGLTLVQQVVDSKDSSKTKAVIHALGKVGSKQSVDFIQGIVLSKKYDDRIRQTAAEMLGKSQTGEDRVIELLSQKKLPEFLMEPAVDGVKWAWRKSVYTTALSYLPDAEGAKVNKKVVALKELIALPSNMAKGREVFVTRCNVCHQVNGDGYDVGPKLSEIGSKLPLEGLYEAIIHPSAGISFGYENWQLDMKDGSSLTGIISSKTETDIDLKYPGGSIQKIKASDVKKITELKESMMPASLHETMNSQEFADLLSYLSSLKKKSK